MNAVASPVRKAAPKPHPSTTRAAAPAQGPGTSTNKSGTEFTIEAVKTAFCEVQHMLDQAHRTDEPHGWSGDSDRLLRIAHNLADEAGARTPTAGEDIDCAAFDIAALIRAARLVPGDEESPARKALLDQAAVHLNWLTECSQTGEDCCDPGADRPPPRSAQPAPQAVPAASHGDAYRDLARRSTLEIEQLAETLQQVTNHSDNEDQPLIHAIMARTIVLTKIIFHAAALHGDDRAAWGYTLDDLQRNFKGTM